MQLIFSIVIIIASTLGVVLFGVPQYKQIQELSGEKADYVDVLDKAKILTQKRKELIDKRNNLNTDDLKKIEKMLPNSPQNVPLILELDELARKNNLSLQNIKVEDVPKGAAAVSKEIPVGVSSEVGTLNITFSLVGTYVDFTEFLRAAEKNLRVIDFQKIGFITQEEKDQIQYTVAIRTYWLK